MPLITRPAPLTRVEPVTEMLHGVRVTDPYRWLEDQTSPRTREWIFEQTQYARSYLDAIGGRERIRERIDRSPEGRLALMFESFGYRHGIPGDADFVFDVRSLPNPYWQPELRKLTGRDAAVIAYLEAQPSVGAMIAAIAAFLDRRIAEFAQADRSYLTIAIGCTGGQHRSVYIADRLAEHFRPGYPQVLTRHDSLQKA